VATDLWTHTQVLNEKMCILVEPEPEEMAKGIEFALSSDEAGERAEAARKMSQKNYTFSRYKQKIEQVLEKAFKHKNG